MEATRAVVVGAGPAGLGAALELVERGLPCTLIDEAPGLGGQGWHPERSFPDARPRRSASRALGRRILERVRAAGSALDHRPGSSVVALYPDLELVVGRAGSLGSLRPEALLLATGAHDRVLPFRGWHTPGVLSLGGLLSLVERHGVLPEGPVVLAGAGPLLLLAAARLVDAGRPPALVLDTVGLAGLLPALPGLLREPALLVEGVDLLGSLRAAGVELRRGWAVLEAEGGESLARVRASPVDSAWRPRRHGDWIEAGVLAVGHGLSPEIALAAGAGAPVRWDNPRGGWVLEHDEEQRAGPPRLWVAGDGCGVHGAPVAWLQGRLAGLSMVGALGASDGGDEALSARLRRELAAALSARRGLERALAPRPGLLEAVTHDTIVCRCEEVTLSEIRDWTAGGERSLTALKETTRVGMGRCQGRFCGANLRMLLEREQGAHAALDEPLSTRPPARPVSLGELASWRR